MADYLILKQLTDRDGWSVVNTSRGKLASTQGEDAAIVESFSGPGNYMALRLDNARAMSVSVEPKLTEVKAEPQPVEETPTEETPVEEAPEEEPAAEPVEDEPAEEPSAEDPVDEGEEPEAT